MHNNVYKTKYPRQAMIKEADNLRKNILKIIQKNANPISTQDISTELQKPWHSIQTRCLRLQIENKITGFRVGRINLWQAK